MRVARYAGTVLCAVVVAALAVPGIASAASASPATVDFGDVPINTTVTRDVSITVDTGYEVELASGSGINVPFSFNFDTCSGSFAGPGTCNVKESFSPTAVGPATATTNVFECPTGGGSCIAIPFDSSGAGVTALAITTASLPDGAFGAPYPATTLSSSGGTTPVTWSVSSGSLPAGLTLGSSSGTISGTPTAAGTFTFGITATDSGSPTPQTATKSFTIKVIGSADLALAIAGPAAPVQHSKPVTFTITVTNHGPTAASGAVLTNALPSASQFVSLTASQGSCTTPPVGSTGTLVCSLGEIASGATATIAVTVNTTARKQTITDTASVAEDVTATDPVAANNSATASVQVK
jgi:uncharacterized repeat protein (TIGR01451 family)